MPYIISEKRDKFDSILELLENIDLENVGELNYLITSICHEYMNKKKPGYKGKLSYQIINDIIGTLECSKAEFYRRLAVPYENAKIQENGDV